MTEVTQILGRIEQGDPTAAAQLLPVVYQELRKLAAAKLAHEKPGQTLQATALVHEAYLRLVGSADLLRWESRGHFFAAAAEAMRRILVNRARDRNRIKRGGARRRLDLSGLSVAGTAPDDELLALDEALSRFAEEHPSCAELVKLRFFTGLTAAEAAAALGISERTACRHWEFGRAWLFRELRDEPD